MNYFKEIKKLQDRVENLAKQCNTNFKIGDNVEIHDFISNGKHYNVIYGKIIEKSYSFAVVELYNIDSKLMFSYEQLKLVEKFIEEEKVILRNLSKKYNYIARNKNNELYVYAVRPDKSERSETWKDYFYENTHLPFSHLFQSIQWEDEESCEFRKYI